MQEKHRKMTDFLMLSAILCILTMYLVCLLLQPLPFLKHHQSNIKATFFCPYFLMNTHISKNDDWYDASASPLLHTVFTHFLHWQICELSDKYDLITKPLKPVLQLINCKRLLIIAWFFGGGLWWRFSVPQCAIKWAFNCIDRATHYYNTH